MLLGLDAKGSGKQLRFEIERSDMVCKAVEPADVKIRNIYFYM